jgi:PAS domain S-box-containing protein
MENEVTILVIDDQPANVFAVQQLLEEEGRILIGASSGKDGLQIALNKNIDLIILDVQMPGMDGFETAQVLKSHKKTRDIPIIFASAEKKERTFVIKGFEGGAIDYLTKPLDPELTRAKVSILLQVQLQKRELIKKNELLKEAEGKIKQLNGDLLNNLEQLEKANKELESHSRSMSHNLNLSEEKFRSLTETAFDAIILMDHHGMVKFWNKGATLIFGYESQEIINKSLTLIMPDSYVKAHTSGLERYLRTRENKVIGRVVELEGKRKNGELFPIEISISSWGAADGIMFSGIIRDVSERKKAENEIKKLNDELEQKVMDRTEQLAIVNKELEAFTYSVSHDLRSPLRSVIGYSKILEEDLGEKMSDGGKRTLAVIQQNAVRMNTLIDDLMKFSRLGKQQLQKTLISSENLSQTIHEISHSIPHHASLRLDALLPAYGDESLLSQVWTNLLSNAIKYSSKKEHPEIVIGSKKEEAETIFYVRDNGTGFDMEYYSKLFGVFQRLHKSVDYEGTGVGLALVKRIVLKHGGRVWAEGKVNEGATFYFSLPSN